MAVSLFPHFYIMFVCLTDKEKVSPHLLGVKAKFFFAFFPPKYLMALPSHDEDGGQFD